MQIKVLKNELEKQDIWLMKAKRLLQLNEKNSKDNYIQEQSRKLMNS